MPTVPVAQSSAPERRIPGPAAGFLANESDMGGAVGRSLMDLGESVFRGFARLGEAHRQLRERRDAAEADKALTAYTADMTATLHGAATPDGAATPGLTSRTAAAAKGTARDYTKTEYDWMNNPEGPRMRLTPSARQIFDTSAARYSARFRQAATDHELAQLQVQRKLDTESAFSSADTAARAAIGTDGFDSFAHEAAMRDADRKLHGQFTANPDGTRTFASPAAEQLHRDASAAALTGYRAEQARHFIDTAALGPLGPEDTAAIGNAQASAAKQATASTSPTINSSLLPINSPSESYLARADAIAATLPPAEADKLRESIYRARATRESRARASLLEAERQQRDAVTEQNRKGSQIYLEAAAAGHRNPEQTIAALSAAHTLDPAAAIPHVERLNGVIAARAEESRHTAEEIAKKAAEADQNHTVIGLQAGFTTDRAGNPVPMSPAEIITSADIAYGRGVLTGPQRDDIIRSATQRSDQRIAAFSDRVIRDVLPDFTQHITRDRDTGNFTFDTKAKTRTTPDTPTGWKDTYRDPARNASARRPILLRQAIDALNVIKEKLATDPAMDADKAYELYRSAIQGTAAEADKLTIEDHMRQHALDTAAIRDRLTRLRLSTPPAPRP